MSFANRAVVITGASSGIGRSLAVSPAKQQARVEAIARRGGHLDELVRPIRTNGGAIEAHP
jgi:short-subunit dehydrogenase